ncbi:hypothetical protein MRB53_017237 [Persea americana]|uniref:Uncharacterized protein n=1 Tax=Persea americana TaxID=3435 RepID=A0ACC2M506_PERAE|nr:hypothetical protein MRB53_017237 [Persea americana]
MSLVFHTGRGRKGTKTEWMMQEYSLIAAASPEGSSSLAKDKKMKQVGKYVLCKIYKKATAEGETEEVSFNSIEDELVDEDRNKRIAFWSYIHEHADDENILSWFLG